MVTLPLAALLALVLVLGMKWASWAKGVVFLAVLFGLVFGTTAMGRQVGTALEDGTTSVMTQLATVFTGGDNGRTAR